MHRYLFPVAYFSAVLAAGTLAGRAVDGVLSILLPALVVVLAPLVLVAVLNRRRDDVADLPDEDCGWCGGLVDAGVDYCTEYCRSAEAREYRAWERTVMLWEVDAPDGHVVYLGADLVLASELYHSEPAGAHLHLTPRPELAGSPS